MSKRKKKGDAPYHSRRGRKRKWGRLTGGSVWWTKHFYRPRQLVQVQGIHYDQSHIMSPFVVCQGLLGLDAQAGQERHIPLMLFVQTFEYVGHVSLAPAPSPIEVAGEPSIHQLIQTP